MTPSELQTYLHDHIPLSKAMAVTVVSIADDAVVLGAPLGPNINHRETVFGGSASAVAILACWSLLHLRLTAAGIESRVVIQRNTMDYLAPISGAFTARSTFEADADWAWFVRMLERKGRARIAVGAILEFEGQIAGRLTGEFVALGAGR
jgi:thioesterase domain-containing protein